MPFAPHSQRRVAWGIKRQRGERNGLESKFENELLIPQLASGAVLWYRFEGVKFDLVHNKTRITYEPDYLVQTASGELIAYEVKGGLFPEKNRMKCKLFVDQYPIRLIVARYPNKQAGWTYEEF